MVSVLEKLREEDCHRIEASLTYIVSIRAARPAGPCVKNKKQKPEKQTEATNRETRAKPSDVFLSALLSSLPGVVHTQLLRLRGTGVATGESLQQM